MVIGWDARAGSRSLHFDFQAGAGGGAVAGSISRDVPREMSRGCQRLSLPGGIVGDPGNLREGHGRAWGQRLRRAVLLRAGAVAVGTTQRRSRTLSCETQ